MASDLYEIRGPLYKAYALQCSRWEGRMAAVNWDPHQSWMYIRDDEAAAYSAGYRAGQRELEHAMGMP